MLPDDTKFMARWNRPCEMIWQTGPVYHEVWQLWRLKTLQVYHINLLRKWVDREAPFACVVTIELRGFDFSVEYHRFLLSAHQEGKAIAKN